jgi:hypothetical protein
LLTSLHATGFPRPNGKKAQYTAHSGAPLDQPNVTPTLLRKLYNITTPVASQGVNNTQAVFETEGTYHVPRVDRLSLSN